MCVCVSVVLYICTHTHTHTHTHCIIGDVAQFLSAIVSCKDELMSDPLYLPVFFERALRYANRSMSLLYVLGLFCMHSVSFVCTRSLVSDPLCLRCVCRF